MAPLRHADRQRQCPLPKEDRKTCTEREMLATASMTSMTCVVVSGDDSDQVNAKRAGFPVSKHELSLMPSTEVAALIRSLRRRGRAVRAAR
jgi:hypothetical protein